MSEIKRQYYKILDELIKNENKTKELKEQLITLQSDYAELSNKFTEIGKKYIKELEEDE